MQTYLSRIYTYMLDPCLEPQPKGYFIPNHLTVLQSLVYTLGFEFPPFPATLSLLARLWTRKREIDFGNWFTLFAGLVCLPTVCMNSNSCPLWLSGLQPYGLFWTQQPAPTISLLQPRGGQFNTTTMNTQVIIDAHQASTSKTVCIVFTCFITWLHCVADIDW